MYTVVLLHISVPIPWDDLQCYSASHKFILMSVGERLTQPCVRPSSVKLLEKMLPILIFSIKFWYSCLMAFILVTIIHVFFSACCRLQMGPLSYAVVKLTKSICTTLLEAVLHSVVWKWRCDLHTHGTVNPICCLDFLGWYSCSIRLFSILLHNLLVVQVIEMHW